MFAFVLPNGREFATVKLHKIDLQTFFKNPGWNCLDPPEGRGAPAEEAVQDQGDARGGQIASYPTAPPPRKIRLIS